MGMKLIMMAMAIVLAAGAAQALEIENEVILLENGNAIVIMKIEGNGTAAIPLQEDVQDVRVKGALYIMENNTLELSVGSAESAALLYTTSMFTAKEGDSWRFSMEAPENTISTSIALPNNTVLLSTTPPALINSTDFLMLSWGAANNIKASYTFKKPSPTEPRVTPPAENRPETPPVEEEKRDESAPDYGMVIFLTFAVAAIASGIYIFQKKKVSKITMEAGVKSRENIMKTLSENQRKVAEALLANSGQLRRSLLERQTGLGKSSLALVLRDLEKKNIIVVDRTFNAHIVKFTEWFNEL